MCVLVLSVHTSIASRGRLIIAPTVQAHYFVAQLVGFCVLLLFHFFTEKGVYYAKQQHHQNQQTAAA